MRAPFATLVAISLTAPPLAACMGAQGPPSQREAPSGKPEPGRTLPRPYEGPLTGQESVAWVQMVGAGTRIGEFTFFVYIDGTRQPLPGAECHPLKGSRHHVCQARLPELAPGSHTLQFVAVRMVAGKEHASRLSEPLVVTRNPDQGPS